MTSRAVVTMGQIALHQLHLPAESLIMCDGVLHAQVCVQKLQIHQNKYMNI